MNTGHFALLGHPLSHSISPFIHQELFKLNNITASYELCDISDKNLYNWLSDCTLNGFNITIPYKTSLLAQCNTLDKKSAMCGSVNTVKKVNDELIGYNTDGFGFIMALQYNDIPLGGNVLICGNGGTAKSIAFECADKNCSGITFAVRESGFKAAINLKEKILNFYPDCKIDVVLYNDINGQFDLLINTTPVGMFPDINQSILEKDIVSKCSFVFDCIYNPLETKLLSIAKKFNIKYSNGLPMLVYQAVKAQEIWLSCQFNEEDIKNVIIKSGDLLI